MPYSDLLRLGRNAVLCLFGLGLLLACGVDDLQSLVSRSADAAQAGRPVAGMGIMVGELSDTSALVQVRLTQADRLVDGDAPGAAGIVEFVVRPADNGPAKDSRTPVSQIVQATADRDFIARASFAGLAPGTRYVCETRIGSSREMLQPGPSARFKTLASSAAEPVRFVVVTGMNYAKFHGDTRIDRKQHVLQNNTELPLPYAGPDKHLGYPALVTILSMKPDFFVGTGDNVYYDTPTNPRAETIPQLRRKWHEQFVQPRYRDLFAEVPTYWEIDDHDYRIDDGDNSGDYAPSPEVGRRMMLEQLPVAAADAQDVKTYRMHRVSRDLQIWLVENRMHRSPNALPDGPEKSIWGAEQKQWLKRTLLDSDATFKVLISPTPMIGPDDLRKTDNHADVGGFQHERDEFFAWLKETRLDQRGFYLVCGDRHWQYHAVSPAGIEEFSCGALVDENSRPGRKSGDPQSTDPQGLIRQPYLQDPPSGGFLLVKAAPAADQQAAQLTFSFFDEHGKLLHEHVKRDTAPSAAPQGAEPGVGEEALKKIDQRMREFAEAKQIAGAVTLVARRGLMVHRSATGKADLASGREMTTDTMFAIASMTKPVTAAAVMILLDEGKLRLNDPVSKYIPAFKDTTLTGGKKPAREITVRDCLMHTNGLVSNQRNVGTLANTAEQLARSELAFDPGTRWQYGPGLSVAGRVVEVVSGQPFDQFLAERIFKPLEMRETTFWPSAEQLQRLARLYQPTADRKDIEPGTHWIFEVSADTTPNPSGGLFSTAGDLVRFYQMLLNGGELNGKRILSKDAVQRMTSLQSGELTTGFTPGNGWGLGVCLVRDPQGPTKMLSPGTYGHGGAFGTQGWIDPRREMIFVLLIARQNFGNGDASDVRGEFQRLAVEAVRE
ncbi:MAG: serine hydrolase [Planctomycetes bacterium]|nr:serine hydrolase [Planctomycetota bacterium]